MSSAISAPALSFAPSSPYILPESRAAFHSSERKQMSRKATQRLSFFLLMGLTLYASFFGAG